MARRLFLLTLPFFFSLPTFAGEGTNPPGLSRRSFVGACALGVVIGVGYQVGRHFGKPAPQTLRFLELPTWQGNNERFEALRTGKFMLRTHLSQDLSKFSPIKIVIVPEVHTCETCRYGKMKELPEDIRPGSLLHLDESEVITRDVLGRTIEREPQIDIDQNARAVSLAIIDGSDLLKEKSHGIKLYFTLSEFLNVERPHRGVLTQDVLSRLSTYELTEEESKLLEVGIARFENQLHSRGALKSFLKFRLDHPEKFHSFYRKILRATLELAQERAKKSLPSQWYDLSPIVERLKREEPISTLELEQWRTNLALDLRDRQMVEEAFKQIVTAIQKTPVEYVRIQLGAEHAPGVYFLLRDLLDKNGGKHFSLRVDSTHFEEMHCLDEEESRPFRTIRELGEN